MNTLKGSPADFSILVPKVEISPGVVWLDPVRPNLPNPNLRSISTKKSDIHLIGKTI